MCFALLEDCALLSGDSVLGCGTCVFDDLHAYMQTLHALRKLMLCQPAHAAPAAQHEGKGDNKAHIPAPVVLHSIYPGHGPVVRMRALQHLDAYIENRQGREMKLVRMRVSCLLCHVLYIPFYPVPMFLVFIDFPHPPVPPCRWMHSLPVPAAGTLLGSWFH